MSYGSLEQKPDVSIELAPGSLNKMTSEDFDPDFPFGEKEIFKDNEFWYQIRETYEKGRERNLGKAKAQRIVRTKWLLEKFEKKYPSGDLLVYMLTVINNKYKDYVLREKCLSKYSSFVFELAEFTSVILDFDMKGKKKYKYLLDMGDGTSKTILHLAAEGCLYEVIKYILEYYPSLVNLTTLREDLDEKWNPLDYALQLPEKVKPKVCCNFNICEVFQAKNSEVEDLGIFEMKRKDETASLLINAMENEIVRDMFQCDDFEPARYFFKDYIENKYMSKTVLAILNCLMDPHWPFIPKDPEEKEEFVLSLPNMPFRYHFYYRLLDGDDIGQAPVDDEGTAVEDFHHGAKSCLQMISEMPENKAVIGHPVVRLLVRKKWNAYGKWLIRSHFGLYSLFLMALSVALFVQPLNGNHTSYDGWQGHLRMICEIITVVFTLFYFVSECLQFYHERMNYFNIWLNWSNYFDILGIALIIAIIPLRFRENHESEFIVSGFAFFVNFLRVFKYFSAFKSLGMYVNTFKAIIYYDISKFALIFFIIMFSFTGAVFFMLRATNALHEVGGFWSVMLQEIRALTEAQGFADDYDVFKPGVIVFLMVNMFCILVILLNVLIGQISYRYEEAVQSGIISYHIEHTKLITRFESTLFPRCCNNRVKHYSEGDFIDNEEIADELLQDWLAMKGEDKKENRQNVVQEMVVSKLKKPREEPKLSLDQPE